ncbi:MAG TPA: hypothetical protein VFP22_06380 [Candidatus Limnocylindrales bacterium]|nr:hypothetical protein [Candidatus Limnocylindrales bacterium]
MARPQSEQPTPRDRRNLTTALAAARLRLAGEPPFSPTWDAPMAAVEELEATDAAPQTTRRRTACVAG